MYISWSDGHPAGFTSASPATHPYHDYLRELLCSERGSGGCYGLVVDFGKENEWNEGEFGRKRREMTLTQCNNKQQGF